MNKVLITYASKYGATAQIAEKIGETLSKNNIEVSIIPVTKVKSLSAFSAIILGSAIYAGRWQKDAVDFLNIHEPVLCSRPFWIFSSGPIGKGDPQKLTKDNNPPPYVKGIIDRIKPRDVTVFHGNIDFKKLNFFEKFIVKRIVKEPLGDFRDWKMITLWAETIYKYLKSFYKSSPGKC